MDVVVATVLSSPFMVVACLAAALSGGVSAFALLPYAVDVLIARVFDRMRVCAVARRESDLCIRGVEGVRCSTQNVEVDNGVLSGTSVELVPTPFVSSDVACGIPSPLRIVCAFAFGFACGWTTCVSCAAGVAHDFLAALSAAGWLTVWAAMVAAAACDVVARVIPREACWAIGVVGVLLQAVMVGLDAVAAGIAFGIVIVLFCLFCNRVLGGDGCGKMVGGGDMRCMMALSSASGFHAFDGFAACFLAAALIAVGGVILHKLRSGAELPLAPFFCLWAAFGVESVWL